MLQGPMGSFFSDLATVLQAHGQRVSKVHFNGGDQLFWRHPQALRYQGHLDELADWLHRVMTEGEVDGVVLFGQMRPIHVEARRVAKALGIQVWVFEEGYLRPDWVTVERRGVNALSLQPRLASFYRDNRPPRFAPPQPTGQNIWRLAALAALYGCAYWALRPVYGSVPYHRSMNPWLETARWLRGAWRRAWYAWSERQALPHLTDPTRSQRWFLVPLQVRDDSQVRHHSRFDSIEDFIEEVVASFAQHAPADSALVIKHHPMDRAYVDYSRLIGRLTRRHQLTGRLLYLHDQHLPTLLHHARGVVTINSTVGLQALYHGIPVKTLADSVYQIPGMVHDGPLEAFWQTPGAVDTALVARFRAHLVYSTQLNASFYARRPAFDHLPVRLASLGEANEPAPDSTRPTSLSHQPLRPLASSRGESVVTGGATSATVTAA